MTFAEQGSGSAVGDLPGYGEDAYFHEDATYAETPQVARASHTNNAVPQPPSQPTQYPSTQYPSTQYPSTQYPSTQYPSTQFAPIGANQLQPESYSGYPGGQSCDVSCGCEYGCDSGGCDGGCASACGGGSKSCLSLGSLFGGCQCDGWAQTEMLMWFTPDRAMAPLVTQSPPNTAPDFLNPATNVIFGDDIQGEISGGVRGDYGKYITDNIGIGGRLWFMANNNDSIYAIGDGTDRSIGRPFFNTDLRDDDSLLVAFAPAGLAGAVAANAKLDIWAAEAYSRIRFSCTKSCRLDFIGGYSHFEIDEQLAISSTTINTTTAQSFQFNDLFKTKNRFDGGQVGFEMVMRRGRWSARSLTKVHLGNMNQNVLIAGFSSIETPPAAAVVNSGGLLAQGNQGQFERDKFAFVPEANFKLACNLRKNVSLSVGYTFIYWDNVALSGDFVDPIADGTPGDGAFGPRPGFNFNDSSLWVQGLDLGLVIDI